MDFDLFKRITFRFECRRDRRCFFANPGAGNATPRSNSVRRRCDVEAKSVAEAPRRSSEPERAAVYGHVVRSHAASTLSSITVGLLR